jgi:hypothetical protein
MILPRKLSVAMIVVLLATLALGQSAFAGKWQTRINKRIGQSAITINITVLAGTVNGTVVFFNPGGSETEMPILNPQLNGEGMDFETKIGNDSFHWRLTLNGKSKGSLHGSIGEMLIDERVTKKQ